MTFPLNFRLIFVILLSTLSLSDSYAQRTGNRQRSYELKFNSGDVTPINNANSLKVYGIPYSESELVEGKFFRLIQFIKLPNITTSIELESMGIELIGYMPYNSYFASISPGLSYLDVNKYNIRSVIPIKPKYKLSKALSEDNIPEWASPDSNTLELVIQHHSTISYETVEKVLDNNNIIVLKRYPEGNLITVQLRKDQLGFLSELPHLKYLEPIDPPAEHENYKSRTNHRSNMLDVTYVGGRKYDGTGITVSEGDVGDVDDHIDRKNRTIRLTTSGYDDHADHVAGTICGAGNKDPDMAGMAAGAEVIIYNSWDNVDNLPGDYAIYGARITSNSLSNGCNAGYTTRSVTVDQQARTLASAMHVFSCGNNGTSDCGYGAGSGWGNITGGIKVGKNVLAVGNVYYYDVLKSSSSRGPAHDGRIKPDICAVGSNVESTIFPNTYGSKTGTSMAAPGVAGTLAQLQQAYKELNGGTEPKGGLIKAIVMNTADDLGNAGPDFKHGFGRINGRKAIEVIENSQFITDSISVAGNNTHNIAVPTGLKQLKVMVYWTDYEASAGATVALINDMDMQLIAPDLTAYNPWVLDATPNATTLDLPATRGIDGLNNVEQVTLDDPTSGTYTVQVSGFSIPQGPQEYYVVYYFIEDEIVVTHPTGGESFAGGEAEYLRWDAFGLAGEFTLEYSTDNGTSWTIISATVSGFDRVYTWTPPSIVTGEALIRVSRNSLIGISSQPFSIIGIPTNLSISWTCNDSIKMVWDPVTNATSYRGFKVGNKYMEVEGTNSDASFVFTGLDPTTAYWLSVAADGATNAVGKRAIAIEEVPQNYTCPWPTIPGANFSANNTTVTAGGTVDFTDLSLGNPTGWSWSFPGASTPTSIFQNPIITYPTVGVYDVTLIATNSLGSDTEIKVGYITVSNFGSIAVPIAGPNDDVEENNSDGSVVFNSSDLEFCYDGEFNKNQHVGLRFQSLDIPQGATINNAYIQFRADESDASILIINVAGEDIDDSPGFSSTPYNVSNRTLTSAQIVWNDPPTWLAGQLTPDQQTPSLTSIVQEIIDRPGWVSGNAMTFVFWDDDIEQDERVADSEEGGFASVLNIDFMTLSIDCNGDTSGTAIIDSCGTCAGGSTGITPIFIIADCNDGISENTISEIGFNPNPSDGVLKMSVQARNLSKLDIEVFSLQGQMIYAEYLENLEKDNEYTLDISDVAPGVYYIICTSEDNRSLHKTMIQ